MSATIDELMRAAFCVPRDPRSIEYKQGCRALLARRILGHPIKCPYSPETAQSDAWHAGLDEGWAIWRRVTEGGGVQNHS